jgi:hypothetical protein
MFEIFNSEKTKELFRNHVLPKMLNKVNPDNACNCNVFDEFPYALMGVEILDERKVFLTYPLWMKFQHSTYPLTNNIHWNVCVDKDTPHHLFRDGLNEANANISMQGYTLNFFTYMSEGDSNVAFWLYTKETAEGTSFIATTMVFFGFNNLFKFNDKGMCLDK